MAAENAEINAINELLVEAEKEGRKRRRDEENAELIANMPNKADRNKNRHPVKVPSEWDRVPHPGEKWPKTMHREVGQIFGRPEQESPTIPPHSKNKCREDII